MIPVEIQTRNAILHSDPYPMPLFGIILYSETPASKN